MAFTEGSTQYFAFKKETTPNTQETGAGGQILRRVTGQLNLAKAEVTSAEKRTDFQEANVTHGTRSVNWSINGEMYAGDYEEFLAAIHRKDFVAITDISASAGDGFTISSGTLTRAAGGGESFITDGVAVGYVIRLAGMATAANNSRNLLVTAVTATTLDLEAIDGGAAVADDASANESATISVPGKTTWVPESAHTSDTFTIERYDSRTDTSQIAYGCKVGTVEISINPDQPPSLAFSGLGIDQADESASAPILTSPTAAGTGSLMAAAIGYIRLDGAQQAVVTAASLTIDVGTSNQPVVGANTSPDIFYGRTVQVTGSLTILREGVTVENIFDDETEVELQLFTAAPGSEPRSFYSIFLPRVKLNSADVDDPDGPVTISANFRALKKATATGYNPTTIQMQDSAIT